MRPGVRRGEAGQGEPLPIMGSMRAMRRVVITGLGMVTPLGCGVDETWKNILAGKSGARKVTEFEVEDLPAKIACRIPFGDGANGTYNPDDWMEPKEQRKVDPFIVYAVAAADMALNDADWHPKTDDDQCATGVLIGSGIGGIEGIVEAGLTLRDKGPRRISPFFIPGRLINLASGHVSIKHKLRGPNHAVVTACSTGAHAIGDASRLIALGDADVMVAGGTESPVSRISLAALPPARRCPRSTMTIPRRPPVLTTATATASSWARAPASSFSKSWNTPRRARQDLC